MPPQVDVAVPTTLPGALRSTGTTAPSAADNNDSAAGRVKRSGSGTVRSCTGVVVGGEVVGGKVVGGEVVGGGVAPLGTVVVVVGGTMGGGTGCPITTARTS